MTNIKHKSIMRLPDDFSDEFRSELKRHKKVLIRGLGTFQINKRKGSSCIVPSTGERVDVESYKRLAFKAEASLKRVING